MRLPTRRRLSLSLAALLPLGLGLLTAVAPAGHSGAVSLDITCQLPLLRSDQNVFNIYNDENAVYFGAIFPSAPGLRVRIEGTFPHARYMSFNSYDPQLRPLDALADGELRPDPGSRNPFVAGARRNGGNRKYTAFIEFTERPADPKPNTMYVGTGQEGLPMPSGGILYRIYVPDRGLGDRGGVPLPSVILEPSGADAPQDPGALPMCRDLPSLTYPPTNELLAQAAASPTDAAVPVGNPETVPFLRFVNLPTTIGDYLTSNPDYADADQVFRPLGAAGGKGGLLSNVHNAYVAGTANRAYGQVLALRFKAPTAPRTSAGQSRMAGGTQLRYWSMCSNEFFAQRSWDCVYDEQVPKDRRGRVTIVMSTPEQRPATARARCGVAWLAWGPTADSSLIYRNLLAAATFRGSAQRAPYRQEERSMKAYYPRARYYDDAAAFDATRTCR